MPTFNSAAWLPQVLGSLGPLGSDWEIIVVDDCSQDATVTLLQQYAEFVSANSGQVVWSSPANSKPTTRGPRSGTTCTVRVLARRERGGQAVARNEAVALASGELLAFVDSDVAVEADTLSSMVKFLEDRPDLDGVFGSYSCFGYADEMPLSRFRNLLHRYVHQQSRGPVGSFWTGLGAIRRSSFIKSGGFDPRLTGIEDVELGKRITDQGGKFWLEPAFEGRHLKRWVLLSMVKTDLLVRAIPWTFYGWLGLTPTRGLNLSTVRALPPLFLALAFFLLPFWPELARTGLLAYLALNLPYYRYFSATAGYPMGIRSLAYLAIHHACCLLGWALGTLKYAHHLLSGQDQRCLTVSKEKPPPCPLES